MNGLPCQPKRINHLTRNFPTTEPSTQFVTTTRKEKGSCPERNKCCSFESKFATFAELRRCLHFRCDVVSCLARILCPLWLGYCLHYGWVLSPIWLGYFLHLTAILSPFWMEYCLHVGWDIASTFTAILSPLWLLYCFHSGCDIVSTLTRKETAKG